MKDEASTLLLETSQFSGGMLELRRRGPAAALTRATRGAIGGQGGFHCILPRPLREVQRKFLLIFFENYFVWKLYSCTYMSFDAL